MQSEAEADPSFDAVIVGSGAGGLVAAITAKLAGLRPLLLEKTPLIGGSSVMSGGVFGASSIAGFIAANTSAR